MTGNLRILLGSDGARVWRNGAAGAILAEDDRDSWMKLRAEAVQARPVIVIAEAATFRLTLPSQPEGDKDLQRMLDRLAPLRSRDLIWTRAFACGDAATGDVQPTVVMTRRTWVEQRARAIAALLQVKRLPVFDQDDHEFVVPRSFKSAPGTYSGPAVLIVSVFAILAGLWWFGSQRAGHPERPGAVLQSKLAPNQQRSPDAAPTADQGSGLSVSSPKPRETSSAPAKHSVSEIVLIGVVGRIPDDAQVLVRPAWGKTVTLRIGDSLLGWRLVGIAQDHATFERGGERARIYIKPK